MKIATIISWLETPIGMLCFFGGFFGLCGIGLVLNYTLIITDPKEQINIFVGAMMIVYALAFFAGAHYFKTKPKE
jgi:hypothetical protein